MRRYVCLLICIGLTTGIAAAQPLEPFGLEGKTVTAMHFYGGSLYAATENDGVYRRWLGAPDSGWVLLDRPAKNLTSLFVFHTVCPLICWKGILAGSVLDPARGDTALVYFFQQRPDTCTKKGQWAPADTGLDRSAIMQINALDGIDVCQPVGPTFVTAFAAAPASIWKSEDRGKSWKRVLQAPSTTNFFTLTTKLRSRFFISNNEVWAAGSMQDNQGVQKPLVLRSVDSGAHWEERSPATSTGSDECRALALHPTDTSLVFSALSHAIIKSRDAGKSWTFTTLQNQTVSFKALAINPQQPNHLVAGGLQNNNLFALFESRDGGEHWNAVAASNNLKGVSRLVFNPEDGRHVYIATQGSGVLRYPRLSVRVQEDQRAPERFQVSAHFPNPFHLEENKSLLLRVNLPAADRVTVRVFNVVGQEMANWQMRLAAGEQSVSWPINQSKLTAGIYFIQAEWRGQQVTQKWTVIR
jgi:hypothetical protein